MSEVDRLKKGDLLRLVKKNIYANTLGTTYIVVTGSMWDENDPDNYTVKVASLIKSDERTSFHIWGVAPGYHGSSDRDSSPWFEKI